MAQLYVSIGNGAAVNSNSSSPSISSPPSSPRNDEAGDGTGGPSPVRNWFSGPLFMKQNGHFTKTGSGTDARKPQRGRGLSYSVGLPAPDRLRVRSPYPVHMRSSEERRPPHQLRRVQRSRSPGSSLLAISRCVLYRSAPCSLARVQSRLDQVSTSCRSVPQQPESAGAFLTAVLIASSAGWQKVVFRDGLRYVEPGAVGVHVGGSAPHGLASDTIVSR